MDRFQPERGDEPHSVPSSNFRSLEVLKTETGNQQYTSRFEEEPTFRKATKLNRDEFDPFHVPPNFHFAELHRQSRRVLQLQAKFDQDGEDIDDYCPCCNYPITGDLFPLTCKIEALNELGTGFPLYYDMIWFLNFVTIAMMCIAGIYCAIANYNAAHISDHSTDLDGHLILRGTLGKGHSASFGTSDSPSQLQSWLHVGCVWVLLMSHITLIIRHKRLNKKLDLSAITPSDYTVMLTNVPEDESSLREFLEANGRPDGLRCHVVKVNMVYRMAKLVEAKAKLEKVKEKLAMVQSAHAANLTPPISCWNPIKKSAHKYQKEFDELTENIREFEEKKHTNFTHIAFVTFQQDEGIVHTEAKSVIKYLDLPELRSMLDVIQYVFCRSRSASARSHFSGYSLSTKRAPEPSDINWECIGVNFTQVPKRSICSRRTISTLIALVMLSLSFVAIFFSSNVRIWLRSIYGPSRVSISDTVAYNVLSFLPSIIVVSINILLTFIIKATSQMEKHFTKTSYNTSVTAKMTIAMYLNTAIVPLILHWGDFYSPQGLAAEIYNIMISNAIVQPLVYWMNMPFFLQKLYRRAALKKDQSCLMTQREANRLFEGPAVDMPSRYATLMKTYLLVLTYAPMMPLSLVAGVVSLVIQYWVDKYMLLRVHARPVRLGNDLDEVMLQFIPLGAVAYACANWIFFADFDLVLPGVVGFATAVAYNCIPVKKVWKCARLSQRVGVAPEPSALSETTKTYEDAAVDFVDDYDRLNPLTHERGTQYWVELVKRKRGPEEAERRRAAFCISTGQLRKVMWNNPANLRRDSVRVHRAMTMLGAGILSRKIVPINEPEDPQMVKEQPLFMKVPATEESM